MAKCNLSSTQINFLQPNISDLYTVTRWMKFCQTVYINNCDLDSLVPPLTNIPGLLFEATHADCFNTKQLASYCISIILSAAIILANSFIIAAFITSRRTLLNSSNLPILSLACSDLLTGIAFIYPTSWGFLILVTGYEFDFFKVFQYVTKRTNYYTCLLLDGPGLLFACMMSSVLSLGIIAAERYIAVFHSFRYPFWITTKRMVMAIIILWAISVLVAILPLTGWNNWQGSCQLLNMMDSGYLIFWTVICFLCGIIVLFVYIRIFCLAKKHSRKIEATQVTNTSMSSLHMSTTSSNERRKSKKSIVNEDFNKKEDKKSENDKSNHIVNMEVNDTGRNNEVGLKSDSTQENDNVGTEITFKDENPNILNKSDFVSQEKVRSKSLFNEINMKEADDKLQDDTTANGRGTDRHRSHSRGLKKAHSKSLFNNINMKAIRTTSMILGAFYICWTPFLIYMLVYHHNQDTSYNITAYYLAIVTQLNSLFNPILYGFRHMEIKQAIRKMLKCKKCCRQDGDF